MKALEILIFGVRKFFRNGEELIDQGAIDFVGDGWIVGDATDPPRKTVAIDPAALAGGAAEPLLGAYTVALNGDDENGNGSWAAPFATVEAGFAQLVAARNSIAAGVLLIAPGNYYSLEADPLAVDFGEEAYSSRPTTFRSLAGRATVTLPALSFTDSAMNLTVIGCTLPLAEGEGAGLIRVYDSTLSNFAAPSVAVEGYSSDLHELECSYLIAYGCSIIGTLTCGTATLRHCDLSGLAEITGDLDTDAATLTTNPSITVSGNIYVAEDYRYTPTSDEEP